jgi:hypothetical protein
VAGASAAGCGLASEASGTVLGCANEIALVIAVAMASAAVTALVEKIHLAFTLSQRCCTP